MSRNRKEEFLRNTRIEIERIAKHLETAGDELQEAFESNDLGDIEAFLWGVKATLDPLGDMAHNIIMTIKDERHHNDTE